MNASPDVLAALERIEAKLDYVVERQRFLEEMIDEMMPVGREALAVASEMLGDAEKKGYIAVANELMALADRVVGHYGPGEVRQLSEGIVQVLDTVRNVTQPEVLAVANEATEVLHHADALRPVGLLGAARATASDPEVQRGLAVGLEILRQLGKVRGTGANVPARTSAARPAPSPSSSALAPKPTSNATPPTHASPPSSGPVTWEGHTFDADGFLLDASTWSEDLAVKIAGALRVTLTEEHWTVVRWAREDALTTGASPNVRRVAAGSGVGTQRVYQLFPKTPGKTVARIAGIKKPVGCV